MGLMLSVEKFHSLALVAVGKTRKMKVLDEPTLRVGNAFLPPLGITDCWRYLGISFTSRGVKAFRKELEEPLRRISEAPLKPHQMMEILRNFLMPFLIHQLSFARVSMGILKALDVVVRASVRRWLKLPKDVALGIFHAPPSSAGLGVPSFLRSLPVLILSRLRNVSKSDYPRTLIAKATKLSTAWLVADARLVPARDYISYLQIVSNSLPTKLRTSRGRRAEGILPKCRAGCDDVESAYHIAQQCVRIHEARIACHDNIVRVVADKCVKRGWEVKREPRYKTEAGLRKPDLVAVNKELGKAVIMDVQVVQASNLDWSYNTKIKKYATKDLLATVMAESGVKEVSVLPITLTWKGSWFVKSASELQDIVGGGSFLKSLVTRTLFGTLLCWRRFMRSTTVSQMPRHLISDPHEWINEIPTYRTVSTDALQVIAGIAPMDLRVIEVGKLALTRVNGQVEPQHRRVAWEKVMEDWHERWSASEKGRVTFTIFPCVREKLKLDFVLTHDLVQFLSGHGNFKAKLYELGLVDDPQCDDCLVLHTMAHVLHDCVRIEDLREILKWKLSLLGLDFDLAVIKAADSDAKALLSEFARKVMRRLSVGNHARDERLAADPLQPDFGPETV
ncbi:hypothetical protein PR048_020934 [Dryococelus australis]|uniref:Reverse transcriptase n=1 Tax=Dryococelus australis TaxID=614101 RepID=A0ABQ9GWW0_9NEOP|nr:hypothetical protein PR048_020934 [Dryococelus australis]